MCSRRGTVRPKRKSASDVYKRQEERPAELGLKLLLEELLEEDLPELKLPDDRPAELPVSYTHLLFGLASDGVYMALSVTRETVVSYTAFPPLPEESKIPLAVSPVSYTHLSDRSKDTVI